MGTASLLQKEVLNGKCSARIHFSGARMRRGLYPDLSIKNRA